MKKKTITIVTITAIVVLAMSFLIATGFTRRTDVVLSDYSISGNGTQITFYADVMSSMGYIRGFKESGGGVKPHYLTFYSTFGGLNSTFEAKNKFAIELDKNDSEIYFNRVDGGYELVLKKSEVTGAWERP